MKKTEMTGFHKVIGQDVLEKPAPLAAPSWLPVTNTSPPGQRWRAGGAPGGAGGKGRL